LKLSEGDKAAIDGLTKRFPGTTPADYERLLQSEGGTNPLAANGKHKGVFQWDENEAKAAGFDLSKMTSAEQLSQALPAYLAKHGGDPKSGDDLLMAVKAPAYRGAPADTVVEGYNNPKVMKANPSWIDPHTGKITVGSILQGSGAGASPPTPTAPMDRIAAGLYAPMAGSHGMEQTTTTHKTDTGLPYKEADKLAVRSNQEQASKALEAAYAPAIEAEKQIQLQQIEAQQKLQQARDAAATRENVARQAYDASMSRVQQATTDVLQDKQPPPFTHNVFAGILAAVAQGMGAYSAAINHTDNFAMKIIDRTIEQDNRRWQQQHLDKEFKVKTEKDLNADQWRDYQAQKAEREMQQRLIVDNELQQNLALAKGADQQKSLGLMQAANIQKYNDLDLNLQRLSRDKAETSVQNTNISPTQSGAPDTETVNKRVDTLIKAGEDPEVLAAVRGAHGESGKVPVPPKILEKYAKGTAVEPGRDQLDITERRLLTTAKTLGFEFDPKTRSFKVSPAVPDPIPRDPLSGVALSAGTLGEYGRVLSHPLDAIRGNEMSVKRAEAESQLKDASVEYTKMMSGTRAPPELRALHFKKFSGRGRADQANQFTLAMKEIAGKKKDLAKAFPGAEAAFDRRNAGSEPQEPIFGEDTGDAIPETPVAP
jgi:hypothetical protein